MDQDRPVGALNLTSKRRGEKLAVVGRARHLARVKLKCPLWSLSVEDLLQWLRLYLATSAVPIPASFLRCAASSSEYATWKPSLCGFRKRITRFRLRLLTRTCWYGNASPRSSNERWRRGKRQERIRGATVAPLFVYISAALYICPLYANSHTGIRRGVLTPSVLFGPAASLACPLPPPAPGWLPPDPPAGARSSRSSPCRAPRDGKVPEAACLPAPCLRAPCFLVGRRGRTCT
jgi:hypothetical protein